MSKIMSDVENRSSAAKMRFTKNVDRCQKSSDFLYVSRTVISFFIFFVFVVFHSFPCEAATVRKVEIKGLFSIEEEEFFDMFGIHEGTSVNRATVRNGIKRAFLKGIFEDIRVEIVGEKDSNVFITVKERDFINKIIVRGKYELSKKTIKKAFILKELKVMRYDLLDEAVQVLKREMLHYGYPDADVAVEVVRAGEPYRVDINLSVDAGPANRIKGVEVLGTEIDIKGEMKLSEGDVFNRDTLNRDFKKIEESFKKKGYYKTQIGTFSYEDGLLKIIMDPGNHVSIRILGNNAISGKRLKRQMTFIETGKFNDAAIDEAVDRILLLYHEEGYPFAQIAPVIESEEGKIVLSYFIFEGERVSVESIKFEGSNLPDENLKRVMSLKEGKPYNPGLISRDQDGLEEFYAALGYLEADVKEIKSTHNEILSTAEIMVYIEEGEKTEVDSVKIEGVETEMREKLASLIEIKPRDPYNEVDISDARFKIIDYYRNSGYSNINVTVEREIKNRRVNIVFNIVEGNRFVFGKTVVVGNQKTKYHAIKRELIHREGEPYNFRTIDKERQKLYKLGLFTGVDIKAIDGEDNSKDILIQLQEGNPGYIEFGIGFARYERLRGSFELGYRNLLGMNRQGVLLTELSSLEQRLILKYREPWFMGNDLPLNVFFLIENKKEINIDDRDTRYRLKRYTFTSGVEKELFPNIKSEIYYEFTLVRTFDVQPDVVLTKNDTGTLAISGIKPAIVYDTRDDPFAPQKGILAGVSLKVTPGVFFSESNFIKLSVTGSIYRMLSKRTVLAASVRSGIAYVYDDTNELPLVERYFLGGRSTVRGYEQDSLGPKGSDGNPTGGNAFLVTNLELRTAITTSIGIVTFLDMGNVWIDTEDVEASDLKYTSGIGIRYNTPVGPLRVDYGIKLNRDEGDSRGQVHFSIGHAF
jgi:outer membrane protein insertion porin family